MTTDSKHDATAEATNVRSLFRNRDFLFFVLSRGASVGAAQVLAVAVGWHVYDRTGNVFDLGLIGLAMFLPFLVLFLPAGMAADRFDRRWIVGACSLVHAISVCMIGLWLASGQPDIWPIFFLLAVSGSAQAFLHPALQAALPNLVPRQIFGQAIAAASVVGKSAQLGGPAIGGILVALIDTRVYISAAALYAVAGIAALLIRTDLRISVRQPFGFAALFGGFRHIWRTKLVFAAISIDLFAVLFGGVMGLLPVFAIDILGVGADGLGVMRATPALGALVVGTLLARYGLPWRVGPAFFVSIAFFGFSILILAVSPYFWLSILALAIYGGSDMISVNVRQILVQLQTPDHLRGRVSSVNSVSINASNQLGDFRAGAIAALVGAPVATAIGGMITIMIGVAWFWLFPTLRRLDRVDTVAV